MTVLKALVLTSLLLISFILFPKAVTADQYFFDEEFNQERPANTLDSTKWDVYPNNNEGIVTIQESGGEVNLSQQSGTTQFPLVISKNAFPDGDFSFEINFIFYQIGNWATSFGLTSSPPVNGASLESPLLIQYTQGYQAQAYTTLRINGELIWNTGPLPEQRTIRIDRIGKKYYFYVDGSLVGSSQDIDLQAKYFWMGEASISNPAQLWSDFKVDYIRVRDLSVPPPPTKTPLIFLPGIGGSEFKTNEDINWSNADGHGGIFSHQYPKDEKVWVNLTEAIKPGNDDYFDVLKLKIDGQTPEANLSLNGTLFGAYQETIDFFISNGYELNKTLFTFPYDWRKDLSLTASQLDQKIANIKSQTGSTKVDLVTHSMGGLVARNYISDATRAQNVRKLIELGAPHLGSSKFLKTIRYGDCLVLPFGPFCLTLAPSEVKDVIQNMPGGFELSPTQSYFNFYNNSDSTHPYPFKDDRDLDNNGVTGPLNYSQIKTALSNLGHNASLFNQSENFHTIDDNLSDTNGVDTTIIAGSGIATVGQIIEKYAVNFLGIKIPKKDLVSINGDDTVPLFSASLNDPSQNRSLLGPAKLYYTKQKHGNLFRNGPAMDLTKNILEDNNSIPNGISTDKFILKGEVISVLSPVNIFITDSTYNQTGININGDLSENIPGSTIETLDDAKFIWLPDEGIYNIDLQGAGNGSFDLKIRRFNNDINDLTTLYKDIPVTPSLKGKLLLDTSSTNPPILQIDPDGDGIFERSINPTGVVDGNEYQDITPPEIQASFNINTKKTEIIGIDNLVVQEFNPQNGLKIFKDLADNSTQVQFNQSNKNFLDSLSIQSIKYNDSLSTIPSNQFLVFYTINPKTNKAIVLNQDILIKGDKIISTVYNPLTNKTTIFKKDIFGKLITEIKTGMVLLKLASNNGQLNISY